MIQTQEVSQETGGFTLVEVMVSMVLLSVAAVTLGGLLFKAARTAQLTADVVHSTAALSQEINRVDAVPFDSLPAGTTCTTVSTPPFPHTRCTTVNNVSSKVKSVIVVVTPSGNTLLHPDTTTVIRSKPDNGKPLSTP
jgi:prepilin-type N-terminal cleavage/methylation domain-containing protein